MISVAMDVHIRNSFLKAQDEEGRVLAHGRSANTLFDLARMLVPVEQAAHGSGQPVRVVMEATSNSRAIAGLLQRFGTEAGIDLTVDVLDPRKLRVIAESTAKCDRLDTQLLLELASSNLRLPVCYLPDDQEFALREHLRSRSDLVGVRTMLKNRTHAVLHHRGILRPARMDLFSQRGQQFLAEVDLDEAGRRVVEQYAGAIAKLDALLNESECQLRKLSNQDRWLKPVKLLLSMPGVGLITAMTVLAELGDIDRFHSRSAVSNYAALVPVVRESNGKRSGHGKLVRGGNRHLRHVLVEAAWRAYERVPAYQKIFERIAIRRGKSIAIVAVARRMLEDSWTMLKRSESFRYARPASGSSDARIERAG
jgi:transposase